MAMSKQEALQMMTLLEIDGVHDGDRWQVFFLFFYCIAEIDSQK